jgi:beta-galactosidase
MKNCTAIKKVNFYVTILSVFFLVQSCEYNESTKTGDPIHDMYAFNKHDQLFDSDWLFYKGDAAGAEMPGFNDSHWRDLDLPHDWSIEDLNLQTNKYDNIDPAPQGPFTPGSPGEISTGYVLGGTGWYRKHFIIDPEDYGRIVNITFDGVYMNADVWINGHHLGNHPYGYTAFSFDITPYLRLDGSENVISVRVINEGRNSRSYSGSGIYRHVWLTISDPLHFDRWGLFITTPAVSKTKAKIQIESSVINYYDHIKEFEIEFQIIDPSGNEVEKSMKSSQLNSGINDTFKEVLNLENPKLWSPEHPQLYQARVNLVLDDRTVGQFSTIFGIRQIGFSIENGFQLNSETILIKGGNMHHDNGPLGSAAIDRAEYRKVELMKSFGYNAIRTSHNPPSRQFLDACDQFGILVMDESFDQWQRPKNPNDYNLYFDEWWEKDIESMVKRDRNHPSIIIWSIGNEINERADSSGLVLTKALKNKVKSLDTTRPVTAAICGFWDHPGREWHETAPAFELFDIAGYNYKWDRYETDHEKFPERIILGTESVALEVYDNWKLVEKHSWVLGDFLWTSMDYLGEAAIGNALLDGEIKTWPWFNANCGDIDLCGSKKPQSYYRDVVWGISMLEIAVHRPIPEGRKEIVSFWGWPDEEQSWNWPGHEGELMKISFYTSYDSVVLELNERQYGSIVMADSLKYKAQLDVVYEPGVIKAIGYSNGSVAEVKILKTTGDGTKIRMVADRQEIKANRNDLSYITVEIVDPSGIRVPNADIMINFRIEGNGELAGVGNANPKDVKSFRSPQCNTYKGRCLLIVRPVRNEEGEIAVVATSPNLGESEIKIKVI